MPAADSVFRYRSREEASRNEALRVTGQIPTDADDDATPLPEGIEAQTHRVIDNLKHVLAGVGSGLDRVVFARVYLTHFERDYAARNAVYQSYFAPGRLPVRTCIGVTGLARTWSAVSPDRPPRRRRIHHAHDAVGGSRHEVVR